MASYKPVRADPKSDNGKSRTRCGARHAAVLAARSAALVCEKTGGQESTRCKCNQRRS